MALNTLKCNGCNIVICEVLSYIQYKNDVMDNESLVKICESAFSEKEIEEAKLLLFESLPTKQRKIVRRKDGKTKRNVEDIINIFKEVDPDTIPVFVARDLQKLPPVSIDHIDVVTVLKDVIKLRNEISDIKENYATVAQVQEMHKKWTDSALMPIMNNDNVNKRNRGAYLLESGPIGLSPSINLKNMEGNCTSADSNCNGDSRDADGSSASRIESALTFSNSGDSGNRTPVTHTISLTPGHTISMAPPAQQAKIKDSQRASFADIVRTEGEWKQNNSPSEEWKLFQRKKLRNRFIGKTGKAVTESQSKFKAAVTQVPLFISNVNKNTSETDICDYIQAKTKEKITMEKINMKKDRPYNAFKIFVSQNKLDVYLNDELWPDGIKFRRFVHFRMRSPSMTSPVLELSKTGTLHDGSK